MENSVVLDDSMKTAMMFESLVIDEKKAKGQLLFRLGESWGTVIIHEKVVKAPTKKGASG
jgi:hypothetical protein